MGMRYHLLPDDSASPDVTWNRSCSNLGNWPVPCRPWLAPDTGCSTRCSHVLGLHVEHELSQGAMQAGNLALHEGEARTRQFGAGFKVETDFFAQIDVVLDPRSRRCRVCPSGALPTLPVSSLPTGTLSCGRLGTDISRADMSAWMTSRRSALALSSSPMPATWSHDRSTSAVSSPLAALP